MFESRSGRGAAQCGKLDRSRQRALGGQATCEDLPQHRKGLPRHVPVEANALDQGQMGWQLLEVAVHHADLALAVLIGRNNRNIELLVLPKDGDLHLLETSLAINAGSKVPSRAFETITRPYPSPSTPTRPPWQKRPFRPLMIWVR